MTIESSRQDDNELVTSSTEFSKSAMDLHFANSWNCTEVFLNEIIYGRQDNDEILEDDLKEGTSESRQEPPLALTEEKSSSLTAATPSMIAEMYSIDLFNSILVDDSFGEEEKSPLIPEMYSMDSFNSILVDSFGGLDDLNREAPFFDEEDEEESITKSDKANKEASKVLCDNNNTETLVEKAKVSVEEEEGHEIGLDDLMLNNSDVGDREAFKEDDESVKSDMANKNKAKVCDDTKTLVEKASSKVSAKEESHEMKSDHHIEIEKLHDFQDGETTASTSPCVMESLHPLAKAEATIDDCEIVADTKVLLAESSKKEDQEIASIEDILLVNDGDTKHEDVVSLIDNSFLPSEAVAKAVRFDDKVYFDDNVYYDDDAYFDDNVAERQGGGEKSRCSFLPFLLGC